MTCTLLRRLALLLLIAAALSPQAARAQVSSATPYTGFTAGVACSPNGALSYNGNSFVVCTSGLWVVEPVTLGAGGTCTSSLAGQIQWTGSAFQVCNGTSWAAVLSGAAGSNTQVQYNNNGALAGSSNFVFTGTNVGIGTTAPHLGNISTSG